MAHDYGYLYRWVINKGALDDGLRSDSRIPWNLGSFGTNSIIFRYTFT